MAKNELADNKKKKFTTLRKGALCALVGTTALAGGLLAGCSDGAGAVSIPVGTNVYWGTEDPDDINNPGKVGDYYIETDDGDIWQLTETGWEAIPNFNIKGPEGVPGKTPTISISTDGFWVINGVKSNVKAKGQTVSINISDDGYWVVGGQKTDKKAVGEDGHTPAITISDDGYWVIDGDKTSTKAQGEKGDTGVSVVNVTIQPGVDKDGNTYMDYTFHYSNETTTNERVYPNPEIYVGTEMTLEKALEEVAVGGTIVLKNDIVLDKVHTVSKRCSVDLAGNTITNENDIWNESEGNWSLISVREGGELTITDSSADEMGLGNGCIVAKANDCFAVDVQDGGKLTINSGNFVGNISAVYVTEGEVVVNGGAFDVQQLDPRKGKEFMLNCLDAGYKAGSAKITVNGGLFNGFNPADNTAEVANTNFVSEGYMVVSMPIDDTTEYVVMSGEMVLSSMDYLNGATITLACDIELPASAVVVTNEMTLNLNGYTMSVPNDTVGDGVFHVLAGGKLTIEGEGVIDGVGQNNYNMALWADGGEIIINGGTFTNSRMEGAEDHYDLIYAKNGGKITINGGVFDSYTEKWTLNLKDRDGSQIIVMGGTFKNYDPSSSHTENPVADFVADGYIVEVSEEDVNGDVWYTVVAE